MISEQSKKGLDHIFMKAVRSRLVINSGDNCDIRQMKESELGEITEKNIFVLTISSMIFRMLTVFHIDENEATRSYYLKDAKNKSFEEVFAEISNLCCGAVNHNLLPCFPHLGMSTPSKMSSLCVTFLPGLNPGYLAHYAITINDSVRFHATLCMCEYAPLDFSIDMTAEEEETGCLELF